MSDVALANPVKLNLGSGQQHRPGYINVDKFGSPDLKWDLEQIPWPWQDSTVDEIALNHVLEHLGESIQSFFAIIKELYRVCKHGAKIEIAVPHPRHDDFLGDPTHVRAFTAESFYLYSKEWNEKWRKDGSANSPLGFYLDVDLAVAALQFDLEQPWAAQYDARQLTAAQIFQASKQFNNVIKVIHVRWIVIKPDGQVKSSLDNGQMPSAQIPIHPMFKGQR